MIKLGAQIAFGLAATCLLPQLAVGQAQQSERVLSVSGIEFAWTLQEGRLHGTLSAPTTGWILVGFNRPGRGLSGARLVFLAVDGEGAVTAEEHIADPPRHRRVGSDGSGVTGVADGIRVDQIEERAGRTLARFSVPLRPSSSELLTLRPDEEVEIVLAYSVSDDLDHHSRVRLHRRTRL